MVLAIVGVSSPQAGLGPDKVTLKADTEFEIDASVPLSTVLIQAGTEVEIDKIYSSGQLCLTYPVRPGILARAFVQPNATDFSSPQRVSERKQRKAQHQEAQQEAQDRDLSRKRELELVQQKLAVLGVRQFKGIVISVLKDAALVQVEDEDGEYREVSGLLLLVTRRQGLTSLAEIDFFATPVKDKTFTYTTKQGTELTVAIWLELELADLKKITKTVIENFRQSQKVNPVGAPY